MIYGFDSIDRVIARIIRDLGLGSEEVPYQDFIEWIADALEHIGSYYQFKEKEAHVVIEDYQGRIPCDFYKMIRIIKGCSVTPPSTGGFYGGTLTNSLSEAFKCAGFDCWHDIPAYDRYAIINVGGLSKPDNNFTITGSHLTINKNLFGNVEENSFIGNEYNINGNGITTSFRYGILKIQYLAIQIDEKGRPLVPDDVSFRDALFWKVAMQLCMRNPMMFQNPKLQNFEYVSRQWHLYCGQARANANMPDMELMIRLKNNWLRLINDPNFDQTSFSKLGSPEIIKFDR